VLDIEEGDLTLITKTAWHTLYISARHSGWSDWQRSLSIRKWRDFCRERKADERALGFTEGKDI